MYSYYTEPVANGRITTLRDFALRCARRFVRCDDDAPLPTHVEPYLTSHDERLARLNADMQELLALTPDEIVDAAEKAFADAQASWDDYKAKRETEDNRYLALSLELAKLNGIAHLSGLFAFMHGQITDSMSGSYDGSPKRVDPTEWFSEGMSRIARRIGEELKDRNKTIARAAEQNAFLKALHEAFPEPAVEG